MADLSTMFNQLGPAGGSILAGVQMGNEQNAAKSEQAMRQAQMDKILMETDQAKLMNPLALEAKQQEVKSGNLKAQAEEHAYHTKVLGDVIPELERVKGGPGAQLAYLQDYAAKRGVPLGPEELSHFSQDPDLVKSLKAMHTWGITQDKDFQKALAVANVNKDSHLQGVRISADASKYASDSRAQLAKDRISADKSLSQDLSAAKNYQAQSVVYTNHAEKARLSGDDSEYLRLSELAKQATAQDLQAKAAAGDARAAQQLQLLQGLGVPLNNMPTTPATPPAAGGPRKPLSAY